MVEAVGQRLMRAAWYERKGAAREVEQPTPHEPFRLVMSGPAYLLQALISGAWAPLYSFELHEQHRVDYEVSNWYVSTHPASHFVTNLIAARPDVGRRYALRNNQLTVHHLGGASQSRLLETAGELRAALEEHFHLSLPHTPELGRALQQIAERGEL